MMAGFYGVYHGAEGLREIAEGIHGKAVYLSEMLQAYGYAQENTEFFDTLKICRPDADKSWMKELRKIAEEKGVNLYYDSDWIGLSVDEAVTLDTMNDLIEIFAEASDNLPQYEDDDSAFDGLCAIDESRIREVDYLQADMFRKYHTDISVFLSLFP